VFNIYYKKKKECDVRKLVSIKKNLLKKKEFIKIQTTKRDKTEQKKIKRDCSQ